MENNSKNESNGQEIFLKFIKNTPEGISEFDYFSFLDHISKNNFDKQSIINILNESNYLIF